ncbi:unnamed protein product, partial [Brenthis ino]
MWWSARTPKLCRVILPYNLAFLTDHKRPPKPTFIKRRIVDKLTINLTNKYTGTGVGVEMTDTRDDKGHQHVNY